MSSIDLIIMGFKNLWRRKARTCLTILGVIIGTSAIVIMLSLGIAVDESFKKELSRMGSINIINVYAQEDRFEYEEEGRKKADSKKVILDDKALVGFRNMNGVEAVSPLLEAYLIIKSGKYQVNLPVRGIDTENMAAFDYKVQEGRLLNNSDTNGIVFGAQVNEQFYNPKSRRQSDSDPIEVDLMTADLQLKSEDHGGMKQQGKKLRPFKVRGVGMLTEGNYETDWGAYMNINALKDFMEKQKKSQPQSQDHKDKHRRKDQEKGYQQAMVKVKDIDQVETVKQTIEEMGFHTRSLTDVLESMKKTSAGIQGILGGIGAVSLLVAALGITNTMIMSIYERTREIGVMKVLGAKLFDIKKLFLFEAAMIGLLGGLVGLLISYGGSALINHIAGKMMGEFAMENKISIIPIWLAGGALIFSAMVGIISGYYPANRAMKLSALEAIKTE